MMKVLVHFNAIAVVIYTIYAVIGLIVMTVNVQKIIAFVYAFYAYTNHILIRLHTLMLMKILNGAIQAHVV